MHTTSNKASISIFAHYKIINNTKQRNWKHITGLWADLDWGCGEYILVQLNPESKHAGQTTKMIEKVLILSLCLNTLSHTPKQTLPGQTNHIASLSLPTGGEIRTVWDQQRAVWTLKSSQVGDWILKLSSGPCGARWEEIWGSVVLRNSRASRCVGEDCVWWWRVVREGKSARTATKQMCVCVCVREGEEECVCSNIRFRCSFVPTSAGIRPIFPQCLG